MCKREGCQRPLYARGMCFPHYGLFMKKAKRAGLKIGRPYIGDQLHFVLPATVKTIAARLEVHQQSLSKALIKLREQKRIHISGHEFTGARWVPIYSLGPGEDVPLDRNMVRLKGLERQREAYSRKKGLRPNFAHFMAPLMHASSSGSR